MQTVKKIGADCGNDALKLYFGEQNVEGKEKVEVMNVVAPGYQRRILGEEKGSLVNLLDVNILVDGNDIGRFFVGGIAFKENRGDIIEKNKRDVKATSIDTIILMMTGIAYGLYDPKNLVKTENVAIGALLPTEEFWNDSLYQTYKKNIGKQYTVKFNSTAFNGAEITLNVVDADVQPESAAGLLASIYDVEGNLNKGMENIANEVHLGIFIGSITTEVSVYEHGDFNPRGFFGIELGTSDPLDRIIDDLDVEMTRHHIDHIIRTNKDLIINGVNKTGQLNVIKEQRFNFFVKQLVNQINKKLVKQGINTSLITNVSMGGGGAITVFNNFKNEFKVANMKLVDDARFANAKGALYSIIQKQTETDKTADEVLS